MTPEIKTALDTAQDAMKASIIAALDTFTRETGLSVDAISFNVDHVWTCDRGGSVVAYSRVRACLSSER